MLSASAKISVSKHKRIKNYLKSTISQQKWLRELLEKATIGIEQDILNSMNLSIMKPIVVFKKTERKILLICIQKYHTIIL